MFRGSPSLNGPWCPPCRNRFPSRLQSTGTGGSACLPRTNHRLQQLGPTTSCTVQVPRPVSSGTPLSTRARGVGLVRRARRGSSSDSYSLGQGWGPPTVLSFRDFLSTRPVRTGVPGHPRHTWECGDDHQCDLGCTHRPRGGECRTGVGFVSGTTQTYRDVGTYVCAYVCVVPSLVYRCVYVRGPRALVVCVGPFLYVSVFIRVRAKGCRTRLLLSLCFPFPVHRSFGRVLSRGRGGPVTDPSPSPSFCHCTPSHTPSQRPLRSTSTPAGPEVFGPPSSSSLFFAPPARIVGSGVEEAGEETRTRRRVPSLGRVVRVPSRSYVTRTDRTWEESQEGVQDREDSLGHGHGCPRLRGAHRRVWRWTSNGETSGL